MFHFPWKIKENIEEKQYSAVVVSDQLHNWLFCEFTGSKNKASFSNRTVYFLSCSYLIVYFSGIKFAKNSALRQNSLPIHVKNRKWSLLCNSKIVINGFLGIKNTESKKCFPWNLKFYSLLSFHIPYSSVSYFKLTTYLTICLTQFW